MDFDQTCIDTLYINCWNGGKSLFNFSNLDIIFNVTILCTSATLSSEQGFNFDQTCIDMLLGKG